MRGKSGYEIVRAALNYREKRPSAPALEVLDAEFEGKHETAPDFDGEDFGYDNWFYPPSPFAELLREAFVPNVTADEVALLCIRESTDQFIRPQFLRTAAMWEEKMVHALADRYTLWSA